MNAATPKKALPGGASALPAPFTGGAHLNTVSHGFGQWVRQRPYTAEPVRGRHRVPGNHRPCILEAVRAGVVAAYRGDSRERPAPLSFHERKRPWT